MIERRLQGEPLAYISCSWEFYGLPMTVTPDVLIPRMDLSLIHIFGKVGAVVHHRQQDAVNLELGVDLSLHLIYLSLIHI